MADIELVIKIPEDEYRWIVKSDKTVFADIASKECMLHAIKNGTPLPKGHGDLIDKDHIITRLENSSKFFDFPNADIFDSRYGQGLKEAAIKVSEEKAVIPADKEDKECK